jgi:hypothetical protein
MKMTVKTWIAAAPGQARRAAIFIARKTANYQVLDEHKAALRQVVPRQKDVLGYEYDFGDPWHHQIAE